MHVSGEGKREYDRHTAKSDSLREIQREKASAGNTGKRHCIPVGSSAFISQNMRPSGVKKSSSFVTEFNS